VEFCVTPEGPCVKTTFKHALGLGAVFLVARSAARAISGA